MIMKATYRSSSRNSPGTRASKKLVGRWWLLSTLLASVVFGGARLHVLPIAAGKMVRDARVCLFEGRDGDPFFDRFLTGNEVRCSLAEDSIEIPTGLWNYYVEAPGLISAHPLGVVVPKGAPSGDLKPIRVDLVPSATLDLSAVWPAIRPGEHVALYVTNEALASSRPSVLLVPSQSTRMAVPARTSVMLLVVEDSAILWAGRPVRGNAGETLTMAPIMRPGSDAIAVVSIDPNVTPEEREAAADVPEPSVSIRGKRIANAIEPLRRGSRFDTSILLFQDVRPGEYTIELRGPYWSSDVVGLSVLPDRRTIASARRQLVTRPRSPLKVNWSMNKAAVPKAAVDCDGHVSASNLLVRRCAFGFEHTSAVDCSVTYQRALREGANGTEEFDSLEPGAYYVDLEGSGTRARAPVTVKVGAAANTTIHLDPDHVSGRVTRRGEPLRAYVVFDGGSAVSGADGEYFAIMNTPPGERPFTVTPCDGSEPFVDVPAVPIRFHDRFDIDLPANRLDVIVVDAESRAPLSGCRVTRRLVAPDHIVPSRDMGRTDADGIVRASTLSVRGIYEVCASREAYEPKCTEVRMRSDQQNITLGLLHDGLVVRLRSESDLGAGYGYVVVNGRVVTRGVIERDGSVHLASNTPRDADLYIAAKNYPLTRVALRADDAEEAVVTLPPAQGRPLMIRLPVESPHAGGPVGLEIDGVVVPSLVWQYYQSIRGGEALQIRRGQTLQLAPVQGASLVILLWKWMDDLPPDLRIEEPFANASTLVLMHRAIVKSDDVVLNPRR